MPDPSLLQRLKERKLVQWALAYLAGVWAIMEASGYVGEQFGWPEMVGQAITVLAIVGFFVTLVLAWYHGEKGRQRVSGPELLLIALLLVIAGTGISLLRGGEDVSEPTESVVFAPVEDDRPSIAVLPFDDFSPNPEDAYFASGIHEEITSKLSRISALKVISRSSVMQYREERPPAPQIADDLGVDFILEGSARIAGDQVRLTAQLIDARRDEHLWSDDYDRELSVENIFAVQSDIAQRVASETRAVLTPEEQTRVEARPTESLEAYNAYLLGRLLWDQWTPESFQRQIEYYEEAIRRDSTFALAYAALGEVLAATPWSGRPPLLPLSEAHSRAVAAVNRALEIDDGLAEAHNTLGYIKSTFDWDLKGAEEEYRRAIELNPNLAASHNYLGCELLPYTRRFDEAIAEMRIAIALSPFDFMIRGCFNTTLMSAGRFDEYHQQRRLVREMFPDHDWSNVNVQFCALIAEERWEEAIELDPQNPGATMAYMVLGRRDEALAVAKSWEDGHAFDRFSALSGIGDLDGAFAILEQLVEERDPIVLALPNVWPCFKSLHTDPRWADYLRRIGVEE